MAKRKAPRKTTRKPAAKKVDLLAVRVIKRDSVSGRDLSRKDRKVLGVTAQQSVTPIDIVHEKQDVEILRDAGAKNVTVSRPFKLARFKTSSVKLVSTGGGSKRGLVRGR
jgi:hypothetical protein